MAVILVVDDQPSVRQVLAAWLSYQDYKLLEASDGAEALAVAQAENAFLKYESRLRKEEPSV